MDHKKLSKKWNPGSCGKENEKRKNNFWKNRHKKKVGKVGKVGKIGNLLKTEEGTGP